MVGGPATASGESGDGRETVNRAGRGRRFEPLMLVATTVTLLVAVVARGLALTPSSPPQSSLAFERDEAQDGLRVALTGGDEIRTSRLTVRDEEGTVVGNWSGPTVSTGVTAVVEGSS